MGLYTVH